jgi:ring-1,2-phenylacetyl-CoA epoxidase subunit PaaA
MFTDKVTFEDIDKMPAEYKELLVRVLLVQVDSELGGPDLYLDSWVRTAPTLQDQLLLVKTAHEEIDHHRRFARLLNQMGIDTWYITQRRRDERILETFRNPLETWGEMGAFGALIDRVGQFHLEDFTKCSYLPVANIVPGILEEERVHIAHGERILRDLCATEEGQAEAQAAVNKMYPSSLDMFGRSSSNRSDKYREWGIKGRTNAESRQAFKDAVDPFIVGIGLELPDPEKGRNFL